MERLGSTSESGHVEDFPSLSFDIISGNAQIIGYTCDSVEWYHMVWPMDFTIDSVTNQSTILYHIRQDDDFLTKYANNRLTCPSPADPSKMSFKDVNFQVTNTITNETSSLPDHSTAFLKYTVRVRVNDDAPDGSIVIGEGKVLYNGLTFEEHRTAHYPGYFEEISSTPALYAVATGDTEGHVVSFTGIQNDINTGEHFEAPLAIPSFLFPQGQAINPTVQNPIIAAVTPTPDQTPEPTPTNPEPTQTTPTTPEQPTQTPAETEPLADTGSSLSTIASLTALFIAAGAIVFFGNKRALSNKL